jgi:hypothetical protein
MFRPFELRRFRALPKSFGQSKQKRHFHASLERLEGRELFHGIASFDDPLPLVEATAVPALIAPASAGPVSSALTLAPNAPKQIIEGPQHADRFGAALAVAGNYAVFAEEGWWGSDVYLYQRSSGGWTFVKQLCSISMSQSPTPQVVAASGDTVVVGNPNGHGGLGEVYVFGKNQGGANNWGLAKTLRASDGHITLNGQNERQDPNFGSAVAVDGNTIVVGASGAAEAGIRGHLTGAVYVFRRHQGGANQWGEAARLAPSSLDGYGGFGNSVDIQGNTVVVGAIVGGPRTAGGRHGAVYVFGRHAGGVNRWGLEQTLLPTGQHPHFFGRSVSLHNDTIVVGADGEANAAGLTTGAAYVFQRQRHWVGVAQLTVPHSEKFDDFGRSVAVSNNTIVVAAPGEAAAYVFTRNTGGRNKWGRAARLSNDSGDLSYFGGSVAIDGNTILVGDPYRGYVDNQSPVPGAAFVYDLREVTRRPSLTLPWDSGNRPVVPICPPPIGIYTHTQGEPSGAPRVSDPTVLASIVATPQSSSAATKDAVTTAVAGAKQRSASLLDARLVDQLFESDLEGMLK